MKFVFSIIATLLVATVMPTTAQKYTFGYMGVFYNLTLKAALREEFYTTNILSTADNSSKSVAYDHTTIYYEPTQTELNGYNSRLGFIQSAHILGYAMDEHAQALLLSYDGPNAIQSQNAFPHTTISYSGKGPYSAVYSNDLWARIAASGFVNVTLDSYGKPSSIEFNHSAITDESLIVNGTYNFTLDAYTVGNIKYTPSLVSVTLYEPAIGGVIEGTFCANRQWNGTTGICDTTPLILPTATPTNAPSNNSSSSSSSSSSSTGGAPVNTSSSTGLSSSASMISSSVTIVSTGIVSAVIALFYL